jgi:hypothetical protein
MGRIRGSRRTNLALAALLPAALATGALAFGIGSAWAVWVVVAHGVIGIALVALSPWKVESSTRGVRRHGGRSWPSIALGVLVIVVLVSGFAHSTGVLRSFGGVTAMQIHVGAALVAVPLFVWHLVISRVRPRRTDLSRRTVLRSGLVLGASVVGYGALEVLGGVAPLPGSGRRFTGSYERGSFNAAAMPVTQWLDDRPPNLDARVWRLAVRGPARSRIWTLEELEATARPVRATLDCTGGWFSTQEWDGVALTELVRDVGTGRSVTVRSATGYSRRFPFADSDRLFVATRAGGLPLSIGHGRPARLLAPGRRGFWWVKWVTEIRVGDEPWWWQLPFPAT